jgi:hypothetical protein
VPTPDDRDLAGALDACPRRSWHGLVWRCHRVGSVRGQIRTATDYAYTTSTIGRWHRGLDHPEPLRFPALYTSELPNVAEAEFLRHLESRRRGEGQPLDLRFERYRTSEIGVNLALVFDCRDPAVLGLRAEDLYDDHDYAAAQRLAGLAHERAAEGLLVWSAAIDPLGAATNLVIFPLNLQPGSSFQATGRSMAIRWLGPPPSSPPLPKT